MILPAALTISVLNFKEIHSHKSTSHFEKAKPPVFLAEREGGVPNSSSFLAKKNGRVAHSPSILRT